MMKRHKRNWSAESVNSNTSTTSCSSTSSAASGSSPRRRKSYKDAEKNQFVQIRRDLSSSFNFISSLSSKRRVFQYQAIDRRTQRLCALWACPLKDTRHLEQLHQSLTALQIYTHKYLPCLQGFEQTERHAILKWDFCPNGDAHSLTYSTTDGLDELQVLSIICQLLRAVVYLHDNNQAHGNIRLKNMRFTVKNQLKLHGLLVNHQHHRNNSDQYVEFTAPESIIKERHAHAFENEDGIDILGKASDVWAVGIALYMMLTRCLKFSNTKYIKYDASKRSISANVNYLLNHDKVQGLSSNGKMLMYGLLKADPEERLNARQALSLCKLAISRLSSTKDTASSSSKRQ